MSRKIGILLIAIITILLIATVNADEIENMVTQARSMLPTLIIACFIIVSLGMIITHALLRSAK